MEKKLKNTIKVNKNNRLKRMKSTKFIEFSIIFVVLLILGAVELTLANTQCKNTVIKVVMKQCSDASTRSRRDVVETPGEIAQMENRDISSGRNTYDIRIGERLWRQETLMSRPIAVRSAEKGDARKPSIFTNQFHPRMLREVLPETLGDDLGFPLTPEEMEELYEDVDFARHVRNLEDAEKKKLFFEVAAKCCQNEEACMHEKNLIPCV